MCFFSSGLPARSWRAFFVTRRPSLGVCPDQFTERMRARWKALGNENSRALAAAWRNTAEVFNGLASGRHNDGWKVLSLPTGSGKTQCVMLYCAMLSLNEQPGVLIVTRFKEQATDIASDINAVAGDDRALASHGDSKHDAVAVHLAQVLAITHSAFENSIVHRSDDRPPRLNHSALVTWSGGLRRLTIIDEVPAFVRSHRVTLGELASLQAGIVGTVAPSRQRELQQIDAFLQELRSIKSVDSNRERFLTEREMTLLRRIDVGTLLEFISKTDANEFKLGKSDGIDGTTLRKQYKSVLRHLANLQRPKWAWISQRGARLSIHASEAAFLVEGSGAILDATASIDASYELLGTSAKILPAEHDIRNYTNVNVKIASNQKVGKDYLTKNAKTVWSTVATQLKRDIPLDSRVLICCHKDVEPFVDTACGFAQVAVTHWGKITGLNDWSQFDTVVILGLPYLDRQAPIEKFMGLRGPMDDDWLQQPEARRYGSHSDICRALSTSHITTNVIQAISRVRCRRTIDEFGNCAATRVFMLLPSGQVGESVKSALESEMTGINIDDWEINIWTRKPKSAHAQYALLFFLMHAPQGIYTKKYLVETQKFSATTVDRFIRHLKDGDYVTTSLLAERGVEYHFAGRGRGHEAHFVKRQRCADIPATPTVGSSPHELPRHVQDVLRQAGLGL